MPIEPTERGLRRATELLEYDGYERRRRIALALDELESAAVTNGRLCIDAVANLRVLRERIDMEIVHASARLTHCVGKAPLCKDCRPDASIRAVMQNLLEAPTDEGTPDACI